MSKRRSLSFRVSGVVFAIVAVAVAWQSLEWAQKAWAASEPRTTQYPASAQPDEICLTWPGDPCTTQAIQWRAAATVTEGVVQYREKGKPEDQNAEVKAEVITFEDPLITNEPKANHFTAKLADLTPGTVYAYRVGNAQAWSPWGEFRTAPKETDSFCFLYSGDVQVGYDAWKAMMTAAMTHRSDAVFCLMAGDMVNRGNDRDDWDNLLNAATGLWDRIPVVPTIGNHELLRAAAPKMYLDMLALPENGPKEIDPERAYSFQYGNALFVVLDGNSKPQLQRDWLEQTLKNSTATWKFALFHQPAYSSAPKRDNPAIRKTWSPVFDQYHVDMVLQGHDHAYLRTHPVRDEKIVSSAAEGTYYVVTVGGTKFYDQDPGDYSEIAFAKTSVYQTIDIGKAGDKDRLTYRAYDASQNLRDEVIIEKAKQN